MCPLTFLKRKRQDHKNENKQSENTLLVRSKFSGVPSRYIIDGKRYDIDKAKDIERLPIVSAIFEIDGITYGLDTVLFEHYRKSTNRELGLVAFSKCKEFRKSGIVNKSPWEIETDRRYEERKASEEKRKQQCNSFTIDDMQNFPDIPFGFHWVQQLFHTNGIAWFMLNWNNQKVALNYISAINDIIVDAHQYVAGIEDNYINLAEINWSYPVPMYKDSMACTRVECYPYTNTGKLSKHPVVIHFETYPQRHDFFGTLGSAIVTGEIKILRDGNIGSATVKIFGNTYKIALHGLSLVLKRIDNPYGNLFKFSDVYE